MIDDSLVIFLTIFFRLVQFFPYNIGKIRIDLGNKSGLCYGGITFSFDPGKWSYLSRITIGPVHLSDRK